MQTYFGHLPHTHTPKRERERVRGGGKGDCGKGVHVHNFCNTLRDLRTIIKAFRGTTPIIHMMSTGKCLQHQEKIAGRRSSSNRNRHADMQNRWRGRNVGKAVAASRQSRSWSRSRSAIIASLPRLHLMQPSHLYVYRQGVKHQRGAWPGEGGQGRALARDDGSDFRKTAKYSNENLCLHYEFLYSVAFA